MTLTGSTIESPAVVDGRYVIVSTDGHAGASVMAYRDYLPSRLHAEFDEWVKRFENPFADTEGPTAYRNWDSKRRLEELEEDGVVAEVLFPNTVPPFYPTANLTAVPLPAGEHELRWEGLKAHNRWMADFCNDTPGRRAGLRANPGARRRRRRRGDPLGQGGRPLRRRAPPGHPARQRSGADDLADLRADLAHVRRARDADQPPLRQRGAGVRAVPRDGLDVLRRGRVLLAPRAVDAHLRGVFDRYPNLKLILTEGGAEWAPGVIEVLDGHWRRVFGGGRYGMGPFAAMRKMGLGEGVPILNAFGGMQKIEMMPSEYFKRNVWIGSSFTAPKENAVRYAIGVDRMMWGNDYPHSEATYPYTPRRSAGPSPRPRRPRSRRCSVPTPCRSTTSTWTSSARWPPASRRPRSRRSASRWPRAKSPEDAMSQAFEDSVNRVW